MLKNTPPFNFDYPEKFLTALAVGQIKRYGSIIKDTASGKILGHLKEVGGIGLEISNLIPINPIGVVMNIASSISKSNGISKIKESLELLNLISSVGATSSIVSLGISCAGFSIALDRLKRMESKMDSTLERIESLIGQNLFKTDAIAIAKIRRALNMLDDADNATESNKLIYINQAELDFKLMRNYFYVMLSQATPWLNTEFSLDAVVDLYNKYIICGMGEIASAFKRGDLKLAQSIARRFELEARTVSTFDIRRVYDVRLEVILKNKSVINQKACQLDLNNQIKYLVDMINETNHRIDSCHHEFFMLEHMGLEPNLYMSFLKDISEPNVIIIPIDQKRI